MVESTTIPGVVVIQAGDTAAMAQRSDLTCRWWLRRWMVNTLEKPAQWQSEFFVAWVGEADHEAALAQPNEWWGPIAETLKAQGHYAQVSLLCGGDVQRTEQYREWLLAQTT
jgi:hypothetical protein